MIKLPPLALQQAESAAGAVVLRRRRRRRRSGDGLLTDTPADDEKPEWARVLEATLDAERQRGEVRAWICKDGVDEHSDNQLATVVVEEEQSSLSRTDTFFLLFLWHHTIPSRKKFRPKKIPPEKFSTQKFSARKFFHPNFFLSLHANSMGPSRC